VRARPSPSAERSEPVVSCNSDDIEWLRAHVVRFAHAVTRSGKQEPLQQGYLAGRMFRKPIVLRDGWLLTWWLRQLRTA
jgi:hypothetical protein